MPGRAWLRHRLNLARLNLSYTVITAPCDGYVGRKNIYVGQLVQPGQLMVNIVDQNSVWVIANYRESQAPSYQEWCVRLVHLRCHSRHYLSGQGGRRLLSLRCCYG